MHLVQHEGAFSSLNVLMTSPSPGVEEMVWALEAWAISANANWQQGQVELTARQVKFSVVKAGAEEGWAALDDIVGGEVTEEGGCPTIPHTSAVTTTAAPETTTSQQGEQKEKNYVLYYIYFILFTWPHFSVDVDRVMSHFFNKEKGRKFYLIYLKCTLLKKVSDFPITSRDVTKQNFPDGNNLIIPGHGKFGL
jgi:hypothetical protein